MACNEGEVKSGKLLIRYNLNDVGTRPIIPCTDFWSSPDMWLEGGVDQTTAQVGVPNTIKVRVTNIGTQTLNSVNVQVWVCDYTLGVGPVGATIASAGGSGGLTGFVSKIDPGSSNAQIVSCGTWTPVASDTQINQVNNHGHVCLAANVYADAAPLDGAIVQTGALKICCDSHYGQRNIGVVAVQPARAPMEFGLYAVNPFAKGGNTFTVDIQEVPVRHVLGPAERELIASGPYGKLPIRPSDIQVPYFGVGPMDRIKTAKGRRLARQAKLTLRPTKRTPMVVRANFDPAEKPGNVHAFDITQRTIQGEIIGGIRLLALVAP